MSFAPTTNVVVVGGTQGIGEGIAIRFAQLGASVCIVGRDSRRGNEVLEKLRNAAKDSQGARDLNAQSAPRFHFVRADLGSVDAMNDVVDAIATWEDGGGVHYLYQSQGGLSAGHLSPSLDGFKTAFNVQILSHFVIQLRLQERGILAPGAQSVHIGKPGLLNRRIDVQDIQAAEEQDGVTDLRVRMVALERWIVLLDFLTWEFNIRYPQTHTAHLYPGYVATTLMSHSALPLLPRLFFWVRSFFGATATQYADTALWETASDESKALKRAFWGPQGTEIQVDMRVEEDTEIRMAVWDAMVKLCG